MTVNWQLITNPVLITFKCGYVLYHEAYFVTWGDAGS